MTGALDFIIPLLAWLSMLSAVFFVLRAWQKRLRSGRATYGVAQQEARQAMQVEFVRSVAAAFVALILFGVVGLNSRPDISEPISTLPVATIEATSVVPTSPPATDTPIQATSTKTSTPTAEPTSTSPVATFTPPPEVTITSTAAPATATVSSSAGVWLRAQPTIEGEQLAWILERCGVDPSYLIGGLPNWNRRGFRLGEGAHLVIEGDEYNSAFFDRGPKFLHYRPHLFLIGPVEFDHADLYPDLEGVLTAFRAGAAQVPRVGSLIVNNWSRGAIDACRDATAPLVRVGPSPECQLRVLSCRTTGEWNTAQIVWRDEEFALEVPQAGLHNLQNGAMAVAAAISTGLGPDEAIGAIRDFPGVARRMEIVGEAAGITVVDDFAHHPTALGVTIAAARQQWPNRRLVIAFEPRSLTAARRSFQDAYLESLSRADLVMVAPPFHRDRLKADEVLDRTALATSLAERGVSSVMPAEGEIVVERLRQILEPGDVVIGCSSGAFDGLHRKLIESLERGHD